MPYDELKELEDRLEIIKQKDEQAIKRMAKYKNMTFAQIIQEPENLHRLQLCEDMQRAVFFNMIKKREELRHLKKEEKDLFAEYFIDFLNGVVVSINDFFYSNCGDTDAITFFKMKKKILRDRFIKK